MINDLSVTHHIFIIVHLITFRNNLNEERPILMYEYQHKHQFEQKVVLSQSDNRQNEFVFI